MIGFIVLPSLDGSNNTLVAIVRIDVYGDRNSCVRLNDGLVHLV